MGLIARLLGKEVPHWCPFFTPAQYKLFKQTVTNELKRINVRYKDHGQYMDVYVSDTPHQWGLENTAQVCNANPEEEWPAIVHEILTTVLDGENAEVPAELDEARASIKLRLYPENLGVGEEVLRSSIGNVLVEGIRMMVCYDMADRVINVRRENITNWGLTDDDLVNLGMQNVLDKEVPQQETVDLDDGVQISVLIGESFFTATHAMRLSNYLPAEARHGALVVIPNRHMVVFHPIMDTRVVPAVTSMISIAQARYQEGPGSISPKLYWSLDNKLIDLPFQIEKDKLIFTPPEDFGQVVSILPRYEHDIQPHN